jgi:CRISPR-associated protein Csc1
MQIYAADVLLLEHTFFASREIGSLFESEPLIGNYALTYALGLAQAPYRLEAGADGPRYAQDLAPLNAQGLYVTPAGFSRLRLALTTFNGQTDSYYYRFAQNSIMTTRDKPRTMNVPQTWRLRMLGLDSRARFYLLDRDERIAAGTAGPLPAYIRLGKFMSKARLTWSSALPADRVTTDATPVDGLLNGADLSDPTALLAYSTYNIHPAPILRDVLMHGPFWRFRLASETLYLPAGMEYGVA